MRCSDDICCMQMILLRLTRKRWGYTYGPLIDRGTGTQGLKININKTETTISAKTNKTLMVRDRTGTLLKQTLNFKYFGSAMNAKDGCEHDVKNRIKVALQEWKDLTGVLCDAK